MSAYELDERKPRWQSFARTFYEDVADVLIQFWPELQAEYYGIQNIPSDGDPLGAMNRVRVEWTTDVPGAPLVRVIVDNDKSMPMLRPEAAQAYMIVQWPHLFRKKPT
uniref:Uncharacterized protein n=1 Tax=viral metagenome TaxID=1070528 RepID=A0A6M3X4R8_9ZZZZ